MSTSTLVEKLQSGVKLDDELVIDGHGHMGFWYGFHIPRAGTPESMLANMDLVGIDTIIAAAHLAIGPDVQEGNRQIVEAAAQYPDRIIPYITINPRYPLRIIEAELAHYDELLGGIKGLKFHSTLHCTDCSHIGYRPAYEYANAHGVPILSHEWNGPVENGRTYLSRLANNNPNISFIHAHAGNNWQIIAAMIEEATMNANVYFDLGGSGLPYGGLEHMVQNMGADRILFGSDLPFVDVRSQTGRLLAARITDDEKRLILGLNAKRLFRL